MFTPRHMFDDVQKKEPADMFEGVEPAQGPSAIPPGGMPSAPRPTMTGPSPSAVPELPPIETRAPSGGGAIGKIVLGVIVVIAVIGIAGGLAYYFLTSRASVVSEAPAEEEETSVPAAVTPTPPAPAPAPVVEVDTDKDGLTDVREAQLGTSPAKADTDGDGLFDKEEVETYRTDPNNSDTDGDT